MIVGLSANLFFNNFYQNRLLFCLLLVMNAALTLVPTYMHQGNKDARSMSALEGILIGIGGAVSVLPGVSAVGSANAVASVCGAERTFALNLTYLMHMVLTIALMAFDVAAVFAVGVNGITAAAVVRYVIASLAAFGGAYVGIRGMRMLAVNIGFSIFAFYSFGAALLSFMLYLMV
jgi:undecaprenyl-diphosphatase